MNVDAIRKDFPVLAKEVHGKPLVYLDNAASTQKPKSVVDAISESYTDYYSNVHRGVHFLSQEATQRYENTRETVRDFLNAKDTKEIVFVRGTTEAINLVAHSYGRKFLEEGDEILISMMEHHSNIVPWQMLCEEKGAVLKVIPVNERGEILFEDYLKLLSPKTKFVSIVHLSNALGTINPVKEMIDAAHEMDVPVLVDGAQAVSHIPVDVRELDCDFYVFSGHKIFGPSGIGVLYGKTDHLAVMPPYQGGGDMIASVSFEKTTYNTLPHKFEAGTPNIAGGIGLRTALDYVSDIGLDSIGAYEHELLEYGTEVLSQIPGLRLIGTAEKKASVLSFLIEGIHPHDIGTMLDMDGIAIRTGHHCAEPLMKHFGVPATARASLAFYNTKEELDKLAKGLRKIQKLFA
ncbi:SufS family cysteine desulfurase [bacterium]|nr:SufS family cysteine desulfurase [bacterium]